MGRNRLGRLASKARSQYHSNKTPYSVMRRWKYVSNLPFSVMCCRLQTWNARYTFATWGEQVLSLIPAVLQLQCWRCCMQDTRDGLMAMTLVLRIPEGASQLTERGNNCVRHGDTAGITTDDFTRLQKQKTSSNISLLWFPYVRNVKWLNNFTQWPEWMTLIFTIFIFRSSKSLIKII